MAKISSNGCLCAFCSTKAGSPSPPPLREVQPRNDGHRGTEAGGQPNPSPTAGTPITARFAAAEVTWSDTGKARGRGGLSGPVSSALAVTLQWFICPFGALTSALPPRACSQANDMKPIKACREEDVTFPRDRFPRSDDSTRVRTNDVLRHDRMCSWTTELSLRWR
ncbi:uncharacterized protein LOC112531487 isoform X1 [Gallus gallus]|uniref:uncharacterized protein LOC112531487 isoform X1 n=1 Tax=Gallus gallus TaxID=9031 RepID=UPI001EFF9D71|nr:uncharacterized protein LOC112531487 isoform X1 [Gallus gallus]